ncbi:unnamed protein product [Bursaphelenchus xylophilus]|uniref:(pine wood nematode) hypothetical protein n=1 Tax=Bursaphelenchus xylophilus TaxID=6326 RepID=A0A1I7RXA6_BURXY|nr:unnamed protein product [Bursaphelenchus xylophilus]CAG9121489.1 unnamed protein product [Bursaphelenchus xylophilus]
MIFYLFLAAIALLLFHNYYWKRRNLPPGPPPLPFLGNILSLANETRWEVKFQEWTYQYGTTFTYWLGNLGFVAVCDYKDMVKYFVENADVFSDRFWLKNAVEEVRGGQFGVLTSSGDIWREHRRFALKVLRDFGLGKNEMEERILAELHTVLEKVNNQMGAEETDFFKFSDMAVGSIINSILSGYRFSDGHEDQFEEMKFVTAEAMKAFTSAEANFVFNNPWLMEVPVINRRAKDAVKYMAAIFAFLDKQIQQHLAENDYTQDLEPNDYIDAYLLERERHIRSEGDEGLFHMTQLRNMLTDLWFAGQETTSSTITWIIAYLIRHPQVQEKMQKELDTVIGSNRIIRNAERNSLPYTNAVIMECQRCCNLLSQNIPRALQQDFEIDGYKYKKGTIVLPQISVLLRNPKVFPEPDNFNPDRFIDENGKLKQVEELIPFSIGKRICLGEGMARMELFLFTANFFNQYKFSAGKIAPTLKKTSGASTMTQPYKCKIELRK